MQNAAQDINKFVDRWNIMVNTMKKRRFLGAPFEVFNKQLNLSKVNIDSFVTKLYAARFIAVGAFAAMAVAGFALVNMFQNLVEKINEVVEKFGNFRNLAIIANVTAQEFAKLNILAEIFSLSANQMADGINEIQKRSSRAKTGMKIIADAFKRLKLEIDGTEAGLEVLYKVIDAVERAGGLTQQVRADLAKIAGEEFGRRAAPLFALGTEEYERLKGAMEDAILSEEELHRLAVYRTSELIKQEMTQKRIAQATLKHKEALSGLKVIMRVLRTALVAYGTYWAKLLNWWVTGVLWAIRIISLGFVNLLDDWKEAKKELVELAELMVTMGKQQPIGQTPFETALEQFRAGLVSEEVKKYLEWIKLASQYTEDFGYNIRMTKDEIEKWGPALEMIYGAEHKFHAVAEAIASVREALEKETQGKLVDDIRTITDFHGIDPNQLLIYSAEEIREMAEAIKLTEEEYAAAMKRAEEWSEKLSASWERVGKSIRTALHQMIQDGAKANEIIRRLLASLAILFLQRGLGEVAGKKPGTGWDILRGFAGLQYGGYAGAGQSYLVGERGPEIFMPSQSGKILSSKDSMGGGNNVTVNLNLDGDVTSAQIRQIAQDEILPQAIEAGRMGGMQATISTSGF